MEHALEIIGTLVGLLYLWLEYRASIYLWIAGIIMPAVYIFVYYDAGLYADFGINIYYLGAAIYGWMMWKYGAVLRRTILKRKDAPQRGENNRTEEQKQELSITYMPTRYLLPLTAVFTAAAMSGRSVRILHQLTQPADHPVSIYHPEGEYLKGLVLYVE